MCPEVDFSYAEATMAIDARKFIDNAETILPGLEMAAKLSGLKILTTIASILRRATQDASTKEMLITWLRYTPIFTGVSPNDAEPPLPEEWADIREGLEEFRHVCAEWEEDPTTGS
jgi:hypothetical protein